MIRASHVVRFEYDKFYRWLRLNGGVIQDENYPFGLNEIQDCAILSFDNHNSHFTGWTNRLRRARFLYRKIHVLPHAEWPF